jgi:arginyl-tRNA synthetase
LILLLIRAIGNPSLPEGLRAFHPEVSDTKQAEHGDFSCNLAMVASKAVGMNPRALAETLREAILSEDSGGMLQEIEIAGPGFLNFRVKPECISSFIPSSLKLGATGLATAKAIAPKRINVEFVSVNPNGPITIGSGRGAAFGSALCNVLQAAGNQIHREYYINDGVNSEQMRLFAESVAALLHGEPVPENGYKGDYVLAVADKLRVSPPRDVKEASQSLMIESQRRDLAAFGVEFDTWFSEQSLHDAGIVEQRLEELKANGVADEDPYRTKVKLGKGGKVEEVTQEPQANVQDEDDAKGSGKTLWLRSTKFGDDQDRVLRRRDGRLTYIASDVAYHADKFNRPENADKLITILGPDHHGYVGRLLAVVAALRKTKDQTDESALAQAREELEVVIFQLVRFLKDGKPAPMRKRDGNIYALIDLIREIGQSAAPDSTDDEQIRIGRDVTRFFYLMRSHDTAMDFDLDLAARQSDENPVFYVQYAHARICSVISRASELPNGGSDPSLLIHPRELALTKKVLDLPWEVQRCAQDYGVHRLTTYATELARLFHHFYDACRVTDPNQPELSRSRLELCHLTRNALKGTLDLLGISAPERMERSTEKAV